MENFDAFLTLALLVLAAGHVLFSVFTSDRDKEVTSLLCAILLLVAVVL
jgi:Na+-driven multidrug efflux pump